MGHTNRTSEGSYKLPTAAFEAAVALKQRKLVDEKENEEPASKRAKLEEEKTSTEIEVEEFADGLIADMENDDDLLDMVHEDEIELRSGPTRSTVNRVTRSSANSPQRR